MLYIDDDDYTIEWNASQRYDQRTDLETLVAEAEPFWENNRLSVQTVTFKLYPVSWKLVRLLGG